MGGHGALISALKNPGKFRSVSAFAPVTNPSQSTAIQNIFKYYFGDDMKTIEEWDATCLVANYKGPELNLLIHQVKINTYDTTNNMMSHLHLLSLSILTHNILNSLLSIWG